MGFLSPNSKIFRIALTPSCRNTGNCFNSDYFDIDMYRDTRESCNMAFAPTIIERLARARADLRMGVPVVLSGETSVLIMATETLIAARLNDLHTLGGEPVLAITSRRAETLNARAYFPLTFLDHKHYSPGVGK